MLKKYSVLAGILISISLLLIATANYPGGSQADKRSIGYSWKNNYVSNLFSPTAINGADNTARYWAVAGMLFLSLSFALFFYDFAKKIPAKGAARIIQYFGIISMFFTFLIATPLHDIMVNFSGPLFLLSMFYITVFVIKSKLHLFKILCIICLLVFYTTFFLYGSGYYRNFLPIMQKLNFAITILVILCLQYFTSKEDFQHIKVGKQKKANNQQGNA